MNALLKRVGNDARIVSSYSTTGEVSLHTETADLHRRRELEKQIEHLRSKFCTSEYYCCIVVGQNICRTEYFVGLAVIGSGGSSTLLSCAAAMDSFRVLQNVSKLFDIVPLLLFLYWESLEGPPGL